MAAGRGGVGRRLPRASPWHPAARPLLTCGLRATDWLRLLQRPDGNNPWLPLSYSSPKDSVCFNCYNHLKETTSQQNNYLLS